MKTLLTLLLLAASAFGQTATITDTIATPFAGTFSGTVTVTLNSPALAQPLYSGSVTLSGWTQTVTVTAGVFTLTLYTNDLITPGGTSYTATYAPTSGSGWKETWIVPTGATTIREIRSTTVPSPSVRFTPSQITQAGATLGQGLRWNGSIWAPAAVLTDPMTTTGDLITRSGINAARVGIGSTNQVLTVSGGMPVWATGITGNASTATALAANGTNCSAGSFPLGVDASGNAEGCTAAVTASTGLSDSAALVRNNQANTYTAGNKQAFASNATTAGAAFGGGITADPSSVSAGDFWYRTDLGTFGFRSATAVDALVAGGRNVAAGQILFGAGAGVAASEANLSWDAANNRLGVGIANPGFLTHFVGIAGTDNGWSRTTWQDATNTTRSNWVNGVGFTTIGTITADAMVFAANNVEAFRINPTTRNVSVGTTTDGNFRLDVAASGSSGTTRIYDQTPTTGSTSLVVRAGAGQSGNLQTWQNSGGTQVATVTSAGDIYSLTLATTGNQAALTANGIEVRSAAVAAWSSTTSWVGTKDLSLSRASAGVLQVGDGGSNSNGTILARIHTWANGTEGTCDATLRGQVVMVQGGAGVADTFRVCRKDAANAYAWTALY